MPDILFILLLALIIFGPKKLPGIARQAGKLIFQFRRMSNDLRAQLEGEMLEIEAEEAQKKLQSAAAPPIADGSRIAKEVPSGS
jgi:sec-independent protein translocase protein TatB